MIRLSRLTDYGIIVMRYMALDCTRVHNAAEVAAEVALPLPTVSKLMRRLAARDLLTSQRGAKGGYSLARLPSSMSVAEIITALEGPISLTVCTTGRAPGSCKHEPRCPVQGHWQRINRAVRAALEEVSLADMAAPLPLASRTDGARPLPRPAQELT